MARETFTVGGSSVTFSGAYVHPRTLGGPAAATAAVKGSSRATVASGSLSASSITSKGWGSVDFGSDFTLETGHAYTFVVSARADSSNCYAACPPQAGTAYGFNSPDIFSDGYLQYTTNGSTGRGYSGM